VHGESKKPEVSDVFVSLVTKRPVFNVDIPVMRGGKVRYILNLGQFTDDVAAILQGQHLGPEWTMAVLDRKGVLLARSRDHERLVGKSYPEFTGDLAIGSSGIIKAKNLEGERVLRAIVRSKYSDWLVSASVRLDVIEGAERRGLWLWSGVGVLALLVTLGLAWLFGRAMEEGMRNASKAADALGRSEDVHVVHSSLTEANKVMSSLAAAGTRLADDARQQRLMLGELSHRVKNVLAVVQAVIQRILSEERGSPEARETLMQRVLALGRAHDLLVRSDWKGAHLKEIVAAELEPFSARVYMSGPDIIVQDKMVQTLALVVHELATNAAKQTSRRSAESSP
jgi:two-component sensor histidine kinase